MFEQSESTGRSRRRGRARSSRRARPPRTPRRTGAAARPPRARAASRERLVAPGRALDLGDPPLRVVDVALHLGGRDRVLGDAAVGEPLRFAGVLPRLVLEPARRPPLVLDEAVTVAVAPLVDPAPAPRSAGSCRRARAPCRPSSARPPREGSGTAASRRRCRSTCREPALDGLAAPELVAGSCPARRRSTGRPRSPAAAAARRATPSRAPARSSIVCRLVISVSRPKTVMNQASPRRAAFRSRVRPHPQAARSATDCEEGAPRARRATSSSRGTWRCQAVERGTARARARAEAPLDHDAAATPRP